MKTKAIGEILAVSALSLALAACGGGGGSSGDAATSPVAQTGQTGPTQQTGESSGPGQTEQTGQTGETGQAGSTGSTGGNGGAGGEPGQPGQSSESAKSPVATSPAGTWQPLNSADCPRIQSATVAAPTIVDADQQAANDILKAADPDNAYQVFLRAPQSVMWWVRGQATVTLSSLGVGVHETNHSIDNALSWDCNSDHLSRYYTEGQVHLTDTFAGETDNRFIIDAVYPAALKTSRALRFDTYVTNTAANNGNDFSSLLEEFNAYSTAASMELKVRANSEFDYLHSGRSDDDMGGTVDFMLFMQAYLKAARMSYPATYSKLLSQPQTRGFMEFLWSRAETLLETAYPYSIPALSGPGQGTVVPRDVLEEIYSPAMLAELDNLNIPHKTAADWSTTYLPPQ